MEHVLYRRGKLLIKTIPKGTLLFRKVKHPEDDTRGIPIDEEKRCITPNNNVFFYPNPFVSDISLGLWEIKNLKKMNVYILKNDIKVLWLLNPSKHTKVTRNTKRNFIKRCDKVPQGCLPKRRWQGFDACLSETMIKKYPEVVGMIYISPGDAKPLQKALKNKTVRNKKYYHFAEDASKVWSIPELVIHPLTSRPSKDVIVKETDKLENNFEILKVLPANDSEKLKNFMDKHAVYNPETFFYTYKA